MKAERAQAVASRYNERQKEVVERRERIYSARMQKKIENLSEQSKRFQTAAPPTYNYNVDEKKKQADERRKKLLEEQQQKREQAYTRKNQVNKQFEIRQEQEEAERKYKATKR